MGTYKIAAFMPNVHSLVSIPLNNSNFTRVAHTIKRIALTKLLKKSI